MKTKTLFSVRCNPRVTINKCKKIKSNATAYVSELIKPSGEKRFNEGMQEVDSFNELKKLAEENPSKNILIKTASLAGRARFFIEK